jgi:hypothetical protein
MAMLAGRAGVGRRIETQDLGADRIDQARRNYPAAAFAVVASTDGCNACIFSPR